MITGADLYGKRTPWDDLPFDVLAALPSHENRWHWGGPAPLSHRYHQVLRDSPEVIWCYQTDENFHASSAAYIFVANQPGVIPGGYDMEDAQAWFHEATRLGIVFG